MTPDEARKFMEDFCYMMNDPGMLAPLEFEGFGSWIFQPGYGQQETESIEHQVFWWHEEVKSHVDRQDNEITRLIENLDWDELSVAYQTYHNIRQKVLEYWALCLHSRNTGIPVKANCRQTPTAIDKTLGDDALQLFRVHLQEVKVVPVIETIDDVLRLRGHRFLKNFREAMFESLNRIAAGEQGEVDRYRRHLRLANEELKKLEKW